MENNAKRMVNFIMLFTILSYGMKGYSDGNGEASSSNKSNSNLADGQRNRDEMMNHIRKRLEEVRKNGGNSVEEQEKWLQKKLAEESEEDVIQQIKNSPNKENAAYLLRLAEQPEPKAYPETSKMLPSILDGIYLGMALDSFVKIKPVAKSFADGQHAMGTRGRFVPWIFQETSKDIWNSTCYVFYKGALVRIELLSKPLTRDEHRAFVSSLQEKIGKANSYIVTGSEKKGKIKGASVRWVKGELAASIASSFSEGAQNQNQHGDKMGTSNFSINISFSLIDYEDVLDRKSKNGKADDMKEINPESEGFQVFFPEFVP